MSRPAKTSGYVLGLCLVVSYAVQAQRAVSAGDDQNDPFRVFVFASPTQYGALITPDAVSHVERLSLKVDIAPNPHLPLPLTLVDLQPLDRPMFEAQLSRPPAEATGSAAVVGLYRRRGALVLATGIEGAAPELGSPKKRYSMIVLSNPVAGADATYNEWYDHQHVPDVLRIPGFVSGQRFQLASNATPEVYSLPQYAVEFVFETSDLHATQADIENRLKTGITRTSAAFDNQSSIVRFYEHEQL